MPLLSSRHNPSALVLPPAPVQCLFHGFAYKACAQLYPLSQSASLYKITRDHLAGLSQEVADSLRSAIEEDGSSCFETLEKLVDAATFWQGYIWKQSFLWWAA